MSDNMSYLGVKRCGCAVAVVFDNPEHAKDVRETVAEFMQDGLTIERVSRDVAVDRLSRDCSHREESRP